MRWSVGKNNCRNKKWDEFQVFLDAQLGLVRQVPDRYMIISSRNAHRFVQFAALESFGVVYRAEQVAGDPLNTTELCVKVCEGVLSWHGEAYFGHLLEEESRVVKVFDSFAWTPRIKDARPPTA